MEALIYELSLGNLWITQCYQCGNNEDTEE